MLDQKCFFGEEAGKVQKACMLERKQATVYKTPGSSKQEKPPPPPPPLLLVVVGPKSPGSICCVDDATLLGGQDVPIELQYVSQLVLALLGESGGVVFGVGGDGESAEGVVGLGGHGMVGGEVGGEMVDVVLGKC